MGAGAGLVVGAPPVGPYAWFGAIGAPDAFAAIGLASFGARIGRSRRGLHHGAKLSNGGSMPKNGSSSRPKRGCGYT
jgi:hypothetical protein